MTNTELLQDTDLCWLAGLFEGEACFFPRTKSYPTGISIQMTDEDVIKKVCYLLKAQYCKPSKQEPHHKQTYKTTIRGKKAVDIMLQLLPLMGERRSQKIKECIQSYLEKEVGKETRLREIKELRVKGMHPKEIGKIYGISHWRVYQLTR